MVGLINWLGLFYLQLKLGLVFFAYGGILVGLFTCNFPTSGNWAWSFCLRLPANIETRTVSKRPQLQVKKMPFTLLMAETKTMVLVLTSVSFFPAVSKENVVLVWEEVVLVFGFSSGLEQ